MSSDGGDTQYFLLVRIALVVGTRQTLYEVGRFSMDADDGKLFTTSSNIIPSAGAHNNMICHPLAQPSIKKMISGSDLVPKDAREALIELLNTRKMDEKAKGMKNAKESRKSDLKQ